MKYSHKNMSTLILYHVRDVGFELLPEELESFFISWIGRIPQKSLSLVVFTAGCYEKSLDKYDENMEIIKKYIKLGVIKKFKITDCNDTEFN